MIEIFLTAAATYGTLSFAERMYHKLQDYKVCASALRQLTALDKDKINFVIGFDKRGALAQPVIVHALKFKCALQFNDTIQFDVNRLDEVGQHVTKIENAYGVLIVPTGTSESDLNAMRAEARGWFGEDAVCEFIYV